MADFGHSQGENPRGAKLWMCKHCNKYTSPYTRVHYHFFRASVGTKAQIQRCQALLKNREEYIRIRRMVQEVEKISVSSSLKNSIVNKKQKPMVAKPIEETSIY